MDGVFEPVKGTTSHCHPLMPHTDHSELIIIPVITNRHYGLEKKTRFITMSLALAQTAVIDKVHIMFLHCVALYKRVYRQ
jgi:hypothetical protein